MEREGGLGGYYGQGYLHNRENFSMIDKGPNLDNRKEKMMRAAAVDPEAKPLTEMPGIEGRPGERVKVKGENVYAQTGMRNEFLRLQLAKSLDEKTVDKALMRMSAEEVSKFPNMSKEDIRKLAARLILEQVGDATDAMAAK